MHPSERDPMIPRPSRHRVLMDVAHTFSRRSTCSRGQVGVVIANEGRILVTGYNGAPSGMEHCTHPQATVTTIGGEEIDKGCTNAVHAEANAIAFAALHGVALAGATMYTTMTPCLPCAQLIINAGIDQVIYSFEYRKLDGIKLLRKGLVGRVYQIGELDE